MLRLRYWIRRTAILKHAPGNVRARANDHDSISRRTIESEGVGLDLAKKTVNKG